jgi:hypothetical protein
MKRHALVRFTVVPTVGMIGNNDCGLSRANFRSDYWGASAELSPLGSFQFS